MKKTLAALAVLGAFAGSAMAADVTLYGALDTGFEYKHTKLTGDKAVDKFDMQTGWDTGNRWGLKGSEDLGNGYKVGFKLESGFNGDDGTMGLGDVKDGSKGADLILPVPLGTVIFAAVGAQGRPKRPGEQLADLRHNGDKFVAAAGGAGGLGNAALANKTRRAPGFALLGEPGEERDVILELKSIADVALVGFPSAGKSSLIAAMSAAKPKIADYPFTTLVPNLGVVVAGDHRYTCLLYTSDAADE